MASHGPVDEEDDPIVAEYDVYITPENYEHIYLLQYPNRERDRPYNARNHSAPTEMRIKPRTGFMEVDVGFGIHHKFFDKTRGVTWGDSMKTANEGGLNAFGVASGFGKGGRANEIFAAERAQPTNEEKIDNMVSNFEETAERGYVLDKQTFGGQIVRPEPRQPTYMLGAFRGKELHLKRLEGVVQMRPQYHHIDAKSQLAKAASARDRPGNESARFNEPRLIQQTARTAADGEEINMAMTSEYLTAASEEPWLRLQYNDEDSEDAYLAYRESLFLNDTSSATQLKSTLTNDAYLDKISERGPDSETKHRQNATPRRGATASRAAKPVAPTDVG